MNEMIKTILGRQTIRSYKKEQITDEQLECLKQAALKAPSGRNMQPCHVRFIQNHEMLEEMNKDFKELVGYDTPAYTRWDINPVYHGAPTFIAIFAEGDSYMDGGIMCENICLAAEALGLGTCIIGSVGELFRIGNENGNKWKRTWNIPESYKFMIAISVGYPDEKPEMKPRFEDRIQVIK
ncbi:MAG: nitroreductase family protein [Ruminococcus sp.]|nr:nitroreductase family protein [Candidatus Copronaster equi]